MLYSMSKKMKTKNQENDKQKSHAIYTLNSDNETAAAGRLLDARLPRLICTEILAWEISTPEFCKA